MKLPIPPPLPRDFYRADTTAVARSLLGKALLCREGRSIAGGIIVETEAYLKTGDPSCHSHHGPTPRSVSMYARGGTLYVYAIHGRYCLNVVTEEKGEGCAVLIRAIEPVWGIAAMRRRRSRERVIDLTTGPAKMCEALGVDLRQNGTDMVDRPRVWIGQADLADTQPFSIVTTPRIGISRGVEMPLRFLVDRNRFVSGRKSVHSGKADRSLFD